MKKTVNFGIVGYGNIAEHHITSINTIANAKLIALCSRSEEKRRKVKDTYGIEVYANINDMLKLKELDVISICTPNGFHLTPCILAAKAGKHVITEKPLEINVSRCLQMIEACQKSQVILGCIFQNRYIPGYLTFKETVESGALGTLILASASVKWYRPPSYYKENNWRGTLDGDGGAALITQAIHSIDQMLHVMGKVKSVQGKVKTNYHDIEGEDVGTAILEFENGALGIIEGSTAIYAGFPEKLEVHGSNGSIILEAGKITQCRIKGNEQFEVKPEDGTTSASSDPKAVDVGLHIKQYQHFVDCILSGTEPEVDGQEALKSIQVLDAIYTSSRTGRIIYL
ncbi:Gfo/Idh/MocA family oxidoreductase [Galbibacter sp. BG1]|uniref:Gfo/Idh/MocA family protein n=1 Tax=Galbibacter sp. BG1 TaxID=1170699 RepID=UPI0015BDB63E|nr:Gfo/Idh/MocA family oxidoreductase [Galbibacter sp. BG1]QLE02437.1 Gfo/Idh/MocA family oxidoreductase [Galbibacter sp. BG1]